MLWALLDTLATGLLSRSPQTDGSLGESRGHRSQKLSGSASASQQTSLLCTRKGGETQRDLGNELLRGVFVLSEVHIKILSFIH